jgi:hypothetical protein
MLGATARRWRVHRGFGSRVDWHRNLARRVRDLQRQTV